MDAQARSKGELKAKIAGLEEEEKSTMERIKELEKRIAEFHDRLKNTVRHNIKECKVQLKEARKQVLESIDTMELRDKIFNAEVVNESIGQRGRKNELLAAALSTEQDAKELTKKMELRKQKKTEAIAAADMPAEGLGLEEGRVFYEGVPFDQCSSAEQLRVSVAIAMAVNPKLKVLRLEEGSLLDENHLEIIAEMAREKDYQVWIERVDDSGSVGIVMEDGMVKADHQVVQEELIP
ncbi:hypothetical protein LCGC14_2716070 [marine sediment metagenome]|uniref:Uncharacterized protein n=1 Tax=marine sediment metagenome TaxID=412755 RepID=A0A0F8ZBD7_9ZZZZ